MSTRTFYAHFLTKNALVEEYLRQFERNNSLPAEAVLERGDLPPAQRLMAIFDVPPSNSAVPFRGCPFHNAAVEGAGELPDVADLARRHKQAFRDRLIATAAEAGAADPGSLGRRLAVIYEGAYALAASCNDTEAFADARLVARALLNAALSAQPGRRTASSSMDAV